MLSLVPFSDRKCPSSSGATLNLDRKKRQSLSPLLGLKTAGDQDHLWLMKWHGAEEITPLFAGSLALIRTAPFCLDAFEDIQMTHHVIQIQNSSIILYIVCLKGQHHCVFFFFNVSLNKCRGSQPALVPNTVESIRRLALSWRHVVLSEWSRSETSMLSPLFNIYFNAPYFEKKSHPNKILTFTNTQPPSPDTPRQPNQPVTFIFTFGNASKEAIPMSCCEWRSLNRLEVLPAVALLQLKKLCNTFGKHFLMQEQE